jgi:predicted nucleotidyltransferase
VHDAIPTETRAYLDELVGRLRGVLGADLVGVYLGGSLALGGYAEARSDVDVAVVTGGVLSPGIKTTIVDSVRHESLPCPARGLELVVYTAETLGAATAGAGYELNLNTGRAMPFHVSYAPGDGEAEHWYALDRAMLRDHGRALLGPPAGEVFTAAPRSVLLGLLAESIRWHEQVGVARDDDAVLNACRALRYADEGRWSSKQEAGEWAGDRLADGALAADALALRRGSGERLAAGRVRRFLESARRSLEEAAGTDAELHA